MIICVLNRKGGSGKTTTATILAQLAARVPGARVIAADTDAQQDLIDNFVKDRETGTTIADVDVLPCDEGEVPSLNQLRGYDFAIVDTSNKAPVAQLKKVVAYSDVVVLPFIVDKHAVYGMDDALGLIPKNKRFVLLGIVKTKPPQLDRELFTVVEENYPGVLQWPIYERVRKNVAKTEPFDSGLTYDELKHFTDVFDIIKGGKQ